MLFDSHLQLKRAYDLSRGRIMIAMVFLWSIGLYMAMLSGRHMRDEGYSLTAQHDKQLTELQEKGSLEREARMKKHAE